MHATYVTYFQVFLTYIPNLKKLLGTSNLLFFLGIFIEVVVQ